MKKEKAVLLLLTGLLLLVGSTTLLLSGRGERAVITVFGVGKADGILLQHGGMNLLIDTAEEESGPLLVQKLRKLGVERLHYLILTHPDKDHIGGAPHILSSFAVDAVYQSPYRKSSAAESALDAAYIEAGIVPIVPEAEVTFMVGDVSFTVYPPDNLESSNNASLLVQAAHGDVYAFFAGDAEEMRLQEALQLDLPQCALYKVPHHGRENPLSAEMIARISPVYGVVTAKSADESVVSALEAQGSRMLYAYKSDVVLLSDGKTLVYRE